MQSTLSLTLDLTTKKGFFTDTTDYNAIGVDVNTLGATGSVAVYFQGELVGSPLAINLAGGATTTSLFDLELDVNGEVANGTYSAVYTVDFAFSESTALAATNQIIIASIGTNYQGFSVGAEITVSVDLPGGATITDAENIAGNLYVTIDQSVSNTFPSTRSVTVTQQFNGFSWVYAGCNLVEAKSGLVADCDYGDFGTFTVTNETDTTGITITSLNVDINYPSWTNQPVITETSLPYTNNELATGTYSVTLTLEIQKVQDDGLIITYTSTSIQEFKVSCIGSLCGLNACLENLRKAHEAELVRNKISKYQVYVDNILIYYTEAQSYKSCGQMDEYRAAVAKIEAQLDASGCDCGCCDENQYIWVQNTSPAASNIMQDIVALQNDVTVIQGDITTIQNDAVFTANNGLTKSGTNVALGGTLLSDTTLNASGNTLTIQSNATEPLLVQTTSGVAATFERQSSTDAIQNVLQILTTRTGGGGGNGIGSQLSFAAERANSSNGNTSVIKSSWENSIFGNAKFEIGVTGSNVTSTALTILSTGQAELNQYGSGTFVGTPTYNLGVDASGNVVETAVSGITASNGLTMVGDDIQLGGTLTQASTLISGGNGTTYGVQAQYISLATNSGGTMTFNNASDEYHFYPLNSIHKQVYTNANSSGLTQTNYLQVTTFGTPTQGFGAKQNLFLSSDALNSVTAMATETTWETDPAVQQLAKYTINLRENNTTENDVLSLYGTGQAKLDQYGSGTFTGTPTYSLGVDASGNVVEVAGGGSGPLVYSAILNQSGVNPPTASVAYNTTGETISFNYLGAGIYQCFSTGTPFTFGKTLVFITYGSPGANMAAEIYAFRQTDSTITIATTSSGPAGAGPSVFADDMMSVVSFKIEIYP